MPYIRKELRSACDDAIDNLISLVISYKQPGIINYIISRIVTEAMKPDDGWGYTSLSRAVAIFEDAAAEMRRRLLDPYEDKVIKLNGDLPAYENRNSI